MGDLPKAQEFAEKALKRGAISSELFKLLGEISKGLGNIDKVIDYLLKGLAIDPFNKDMYISLSQSFEIRRNNNKAIETLLDGVQILQDDYELLKYTGLVLYKYGRYENALEVLRRANKINPEDKKTAKIIQILETSRIIKSFKKLPVPL